MFRVSRRILEHPYTYFTSSHFKHDSKTKISLFVLKVNLVGYIQHTSTRSSFTRWDKRLYIFLRSENNIGQTLWPLGSRVIIVHYFPFLVVYFLTLLVTEQQHNASEEEYCCTPTYTIRPSKFPYCAVSWNTIIIKLSNLLFMVNYLIG